MTRALPPRRLLLARAFPAVAFPLAAAATSAAAQSRPDPARAGAARADSVARARDSVARLPPVTITAARAPRPTLDVPAAVSVVAPRDYAFRRGFGLDEALALVPGVLAQSRYGTSDVRLMIRGYGARGAGDRSNAGTSRGVRVLVDGVPETEPDGRTAFDNVDLAAAEGIEVVRSNASALWGNAAGGVVALSTVPRIGRDLVEVQAQAGSFGLRRYVGRLATRLGDAPDAPTAYATFTNTAFDGWRARSDARRTTVAAGIVAPVGTPDASGAAPTTVRASLLAANNLFHIPGPLTLAQLDADPRQANALYASRDERRHNRVGARGRGRRSPRRRALGGRTLFLNPKSLERSERGTYRDFTRQHAGGSLVYGYAGRLLGGALGGATHRVTAGADGAYQDGAILFYSLTARGTRGGTLRTNKNEGAGNVGAFVQDEVPLGPRAALTLGARYDAVRYDYRDFLTPRLDDARRFSRVTPKLGLSVRVAPAHAVYASAGGGLEAPAGNETDPAPPLDTVQAINPLLDAIRSTTYETGAKGTFLDRAGAPAAGLLRRLAYDAAVYLTDVRNEVVPYAGGRFYFTAGRARRAGAELGLTADAAGGLSLRASGTVNRHRYVDYVVDSTYYGRPGAAADYGGNRVVGVPDAFYAGEVAWSRATPALADRSPARASRRASACRAAAATSPTTPTRCASRRPPSPVRRSPSRPRSAGGRHWRSGQRARACARSSRSRTSSTAGTRRARSSTPTGWAVRRSPTSPGCRAAWWSASRWAAAVRRRALPADG
jgi:iron complex outermembrane receptor protein